MATKWLLLVVAASSLGVDCQSTTDDGACSDELVRQWQTDTDRLLDNQQRILEILQQHQTILKHFERPRDCAELYDSGERSDGVYTVYVGCSQRPVHVYCDMTNNGGGWTVFQRRQDGSVDFFRNWNDYKTGFGNLSGEFWLGNDNLHLLTSDKRHLLRVDLADFDGNARYAEYDDFLVDSFRENYTLVSIGNYIGTAGDSLRSHVGQMFSTRDQDNDVWENACAVSFKGAWWYMDCHDSNLNGAYLGGPTSTYADSIVWQAWRGDHYSLRFTQMKIRPFHQ